MAMGFTPEVVRHVAELARLELTDEEVERYARELTSILDYVAQLQELDLDDVEPTTHVVDLVCRLRPDEVAQPLTREQALANAPAVEQDQFKVPRIIEEGEV